MSTALTTEPTEQQRKQAFFDLTWATALAMTHQSVSDESTGCLYRAPDKNACFIGARIPNEIYVPAMDTQEGLNVWELFDHFPTVQEFFHAQGWTTSYGFLQRLQSIHDLHFADRMSYLRDFAMEHYLTIPATA